MNRVHLSRSVALVALLLMIGQALLGPLPTLAHDSPPSVPDTIAVPAGSVLLFKRHAQGVQIYACVNGQWALHAPKAVLTNPHSHRRTGIHYGGIDRGLTPGPWWESLRDGSRIRGGNAVSAPSPNPASIPLLRLQVLEHQGAGVFSQVSYIQRLNTVGGVAPTGACDTSKQRRVHYTADYYFYRNP
jgi:Protein of unknown function (DUF3455)